MAVDLQKLVQELVDKADLTETEISETLRARGIECSQPTINRLKNGKIGRASFTLGTAIIALHKEKVRSSRAA